MEINESLQSFTLDKEHFISKQQNDKAFKNNFIASIRLSKSQFLVIYEWENELFNTSGVGFRIWANWNEQKNDFLPNKKGFHVSKQVFCDQLFPELLKYTNSISNQSDKSA